MAFCEGCGAALSDGAHFCPKCGRAVVGSPEGSAETAAPPSLPSSSEPSPPAPAAEEKPAGQQKRRWRRYVFTLGVWAIVPLTRRLWRSGHRLAAVLVGGGSLVVVIIIIAAIASGGSNTPTNNSALTPAEATTSASPPATTASATPQVPKSEQDARGWIKDHGLDADRVQANLQDVEVAVGLAIKSPTQANVDQLAQLAQQAHDNLDAIRDDFAGGYGTDTLGSAELNAFSGANDLKNAMGALVAYTGDPNPATLAHFNSQYQQAAGEWNSGVRVIWRVAHRKRPPTI